ncbi:MAG: isocitrate dehydrogenase [Bacteroidetes bacterium CG12_big_fil_rev_8_21_14_0_65_60_17]|nr:MAG: isocitrate dehydrogenase [Bacteroidetes bacterium CG12_big_fil_rev_8_21_14_0_65_60_17]
MAQQIPVTIARGDGIGPEIMEATLLILDAAGAPLRYDEIKVGKEMFEEGHTSGLAPDAWDVIRRNKVFLKAPITTPQGGGYKSLNVTIRTSLSLYANVRPSKSYAPFVTSKHPTMDLVIVRENEEDLYSGIEHQQTNEVAQVLKLITRPGTERIVRYAFEYARAYGREAVTCMTKDNIMKHTDGLFHKVFDEIAAEYPDIEADHYIVDIGAARVAEQPERFDVICTLNLYGDILSDIASQIAGSVGLAGSANIGDEVAMFEAIHGSAPDIAGRKIANPSGLLVAATQMLVHLGLGDVAERIENAWLCALESGVHTADIYREGLSEREVGTFGFTDVVIANLGNEPRKLRRVKYKKGAIKVPKPRRTTSMKVLEGIDVFLDWDEGDRNPDVLGKALETAAAGTAMQLTTITNRGVKVYPDGLPETFWSDHWRCRFVLASVGAQLTFDDLLVLLAAIHGAGLDVIKTEHLYTFDGVRGYSLGQGE